jgi:hypothetical protein
MNKRDLVILASKIYRLQLLKEKNVYGQLLSR